MSFLLRFLAQAKQTPETTAVQDDRGKLTYAELENKSASLSALFHEKGLQAGESVGVLLPRTRDVAVTALAIMRAGGTYLPMDAEYPTERLGYMLKDASAALVVTTRNLWDEKALDFPSAKLLFIEDFEANDARYDADVAPDSPAYLLYTSGTTGKPKGVLHTHRSLTAMTEQWEDERFASTGVVANFTFIASVFMMFPPLIVGGTCHIVPNEAKADMNALAEYVEEHGIRQLFLPASLAASMVEEYPLDGVTVFSAGEKLRNFHAKGRCRVINAYGSTEGVVVLAATAKGDELDIPLGKPCKGISARLVDDSFNDVAAGAIGELVYTGDIMAERYLGLDEQTAAKWQTADGKRWYRTGDRMREENGMLHYVGRSDNMVKIRGFRVETGEVENCIRAAEKRISDTVVVLRNLHGIDYLCCYYTATAPIDVEELKHAIGGHLAAYMLPDLWVALDEFPRNPNGKIMRNALPEPQQHLEALSALYSEVELRVEEAARIVLGLDTPIDIDESFIHLGGDSLRAMKLSAMLREQGIKVSGAEILRLKILRRIAEEADVAYERLWSAEQFAQVKLRFSQWGENIQKVLPLTSGQDDMLYSELIFPDCTDNRSIYVLDIDSDVTAEELAAAVRKTCELQEELRAAVVYQGVSVFQQVITDRVIPSQRVELSSFEEVAELCDRMKRAPIDLEHSPAMEVVYARTDEGGLLIAKVMHVSLGLCGVRKALAGILGELMRTRPEDSSIAEWHDMLGLAIEEDDTRVEGASKTTRILGQLKGERDEIAVYSQHPGKKSVVFVHTGNSGSDAYYKLAEEIGDVCSFAVIEPYNLYNPHDPIEGGIKAIAKKYVEILRRHQPEGPYILGGWCYGGVVAQEMACQLVDTGETVERLIMLDSHAVVDPVAKKLFTTMSSFNKREYFETSPIFADLRAQGLLDSVVANSKRVARDLALHEPGTFDGPVTYFKPKVTPAGMSGDSLAYWQNMMTHRAGGFENFCTDIDVILTPHEHDLMMDEESLEIIVPELMKHLQ